MSFRLFATDFSEDPQDIGQDEPLAVHRLPQRNRALAGTITTYIGTLDLREGLIMSIETETIDRSLIDEITSYWQDKPSNLADEMVDEYGPPDEVTTERFFWNEVGDWKRIQLYRDGTPHNFPKKHEDHLRQTISYRIDPAGAEALLAFDGSNVLWRTRGELSADCHKEEMNVLTLNLAHDIVQGEKTVDEARQAFAEITIKHQMKMEPKYTQQLMFVPPETDQGDPDESITTDTMKQDVKEAVGMESEEE